MKLDKISEPESAPRIVMSSGKWDVRIVQYRKSIARLATVDGRGQGALAPGP